MLWVLPFWVFRFGWKGGVRTIAGLNWTLQEPEHAVFFQQL